MLEAVTRGQATDTLLAALAMQEEKAKELDRKLAALDAQPRPVSLDHARLAARLQPLGHHVRGVLTTRGPAARLVLQRLLSGRRVACGPFRMPGRRGYHFSATGSYGGTPASAAGTTPPRLVTPILTILPRHAKRAHTRCGWGYGSH